MREENLFLVICAPGRTNEDVRDDLPANTIVLNRRLLENLYSPSLASQLEFILGEEERRYKESSSKVFFFF